MARSSQFHNGIDKKMAFFCLLLMLSLSHLCDSFQSSSLRPSRISEKLFPTDCGRRPYFESMGGRNKRLVNSHYSSFAEYPWQVAIDVRRATVCSGSLINSEWVLTAAHCLNKRSAYSIILRLGEWDKTATNEPLKDVNITVDKVIIHPRFDAKKFLREGYDIALLKMVQPIRFQPHIQPICLPEKSDDQNITGQMMKLPGWGKIFDNDKSSSILQEVALPIVDIDTCRNIFADFRNPVGSLHDVLCAGYTHGKIGVCYGDSGGGLQMEGKDGKWILIGFTSWIRTICAERNSVTVFTRVTSYIPWIRRKLMLDAIP